MILNNEQEKAVFTEKKNVLVASAAGSGKTTCLTERLKYLLTLGGDPNKIYAITYTNAAAQEMRERVGETQAFIGTIHSLANRILLMNGVDTTSYIEEEEFDQLFELVKRDKNISLPEVDYLLIDEFQDICDNEYEFMIETLKPKSFFACGDSQQSIYAWKGGNYKFFMNLINDPFTTIYELRNNYRCGRRIIDFGEKFLENMYDIYRVKNNCVSDIDGRVFLRDFSYQDIIEFLEDKDFGEYKDWFILCRTNAEVDGVMRVLEKKEIPSLNFRKAELTLDELKEKVNSNAVKVLTIHTAKGLESKNVIVVGAKTFNPEERRVCYVAATRAKENLVWMKSERKQKKEVKLVHWN